jgi:hypothetical protein
MRIQGWRGKEVFAEIAEQALQNANALMDDVVLAAKRRCPVGTITREGKFSGGNVSFTPRTGRNRGRLVQFRTERRWMGRSPGDLQRTIRRVTKPKTGNIRVYAGNFKIYWAYMVERGTAKTAAQPFLRTAFHAAKTVVTRFIQNGA